VTIFERLIRDFSSKGKFTILCVDRGGWLSSYRFLYTLNSFPQLNLILIFSSSVVTCHHVLNVTRALTHCTIAIAIAIAIASTMYRCFLTSIIFVYKLVCYRLDHHKCITQSLIHHATVGRSTQPNKPSIRASSSKHSSCVTFPFAPRFVVYIRRPQIRKGSPTYFSLLSKSPRRALLFHPIQ
jgi:hypothetical protein